MGEKYPDPEEQWREIDKEVNEKIKNTGKKKEWDNPLQEKYSELCSKYSIEYGSHDGSDECERLLDDMRAFERVFRIMNWRRTPKK